MDKIWKSSLVVVRFDLLPAQGVTTKNVFSFTLTTLNQLKINWKFIRALEFDHGFHKFFDSYKETTYLFNNHLQAPVWLQINWIYSTIAATTKFILSDHIIITMLRKMVHREKNGVLRRELKEQSMLHIDHFL